MTLDPLSIAPGAARVRGPPAGAVRRRPLSHLRGSGPRRRGVERVRRAAAVPGAAPLVLPGGRLRALPGFLRRGLRPAPGGGPGPAGAGDPRRPGRGLLHPGMVRGSAAQYLHRLAGSRSGGAAAPRARPRRGVGRRRRGLQRIVRHLRRTAGSDRVARVPGRTRRPGGTGEGGGRPGASAAAAGGASLGAGARLPERPAPGCQAACQGAGVRGGAGLLRRRPRALRRRPLRRAHGGAEQRQPRVCGHLRGSGARVRGRVRVRRPRLAGVLPAGPGHRAARSGGAPAGPAALRRPAGSTGWRSPRRRAR